MKWKILLHQRGVLKIHTQSREIWKDVVDYESIYEVSNEGNVRSLDRTIIRKDGVETNLKGKVLTHNICRKGYSRVKLSRLGKGKYATIHRLVALAFIPNSNQYPQINHIDGLKDNNNVDNLEWCTNRYNMNHAIENGLMKFDSTAMVIHQYTMDGEFIKTYPSALQAERETGIYSSGISMCLRGFYKHSGNFIWRYADD